MSRYTFRADHPRYRVHVGVDPCLSTLFAQVEDLAWESNGAAMNEQAEIGDAPEEGLVLWLGGTVREIVEVEKVVQAVAPYGVVPLALQLALVRDLDRIRPQSLRALGDQLARICQQVPRARLPIQAALHSRSFILLNENGWHLCAWETLPAGPLDQAFALLLDPTHEGRPQSYPESAHAYVSDPSIVLSVQEDGFLRRLPIYALLARGVMFSGPVIISQEGEGLTPAQVETIRQEVLFVDETLRPAVTDLHYSAWQTISTRGWAGQNGILLDS